jgi:hypothetical protein
MGYLLSRPCPQCAQIIAGLAALGIVAVPMGCNHEYGSHDHLPEVEIHDALSEPVLSQITNLSMSATGFSATVGTVSLTATRV